MYCCITKSGESSIRLGWLFTSGLITLIWLSAYNVSAQSTTIDDFNDGILDGWFVDDLTVLLNQPWGPGIAGINGKGELVLASRHPIPIRSNQGVIAAGWDEGLVDPQYSNGTLRAKLQLKTDFTSAGFVLRTNGSFATGYTNYAFEVAAGSRGDKTDYCIHRMANSTFVDGTCISTSDSVVGSDLWLEMTVIDDQMSFKFWPADASEPATPQVTWQDSTLESGTIGLFAFQNRPGSFLEGHFGAVFDDLTFTPANSSAVVPEPAGHWLLKGALAVLLSCRRRKYRAVRQPAKSSNVLPVTSVHNTHTLKPWFRCWNAAVPLLCLAMGLGFTHESRADLLFDLGQLQVAGPPVLPNIGIPLEIPAGERVTDFEVVVDWSQHSGNPFSSEATWAISNKSLYEADRTTFVGPGSSPDGGEGDVEGPKARKLTWVGKLDLPLSGPAEVIFQPYQFCCSSFPGFAANWDNTVIRLFSADPEIPLQLDGNLGSVAAPFSPFNVNTLAADFDTELGIYSETGKLIALNDDIIRGPEVAGSVQSQVDFEFGLPAGAYYAAFGGLGTEFHDDFQVTPSLIGGSYSLAAGEASVDGSLSENEVAFIAFRIGTLEGDFDDDGLLSAADIDLLVPGSPNLEFDVDGNGVVDDQDRQFWVEKMFGTFFGDTDLNREVNVSDFLTLSGNFGNAGGWAEGDFDVSGDVQFADFLQLSANFGNTKIAAATVPEPNSPVLMLLAVVSLCAVRRRDASTQTRPFD